MAPEAVKCNWQPEVRTTAASVRAVPRPSASREYSMVGEVFCLCSIKCVMGIICRRKKLPTKADNYFSGVSRTVAFREEGIVV